MAQPRDQARATIRTSCVLGLGCFYSLLVVADSAKGIAPLSALGVVASAYAALGTIGLVVRVRGVARTYSCVAGVLAALMLAPAVIAEWRAVSVASPLLVSVCAVLLTGLAAIGSLRTQDRDWWPLAVLAVCMGCLGILSALLHGLGITMTSDLRIVASEGPLSRSLGIGLPLLVPLAAISLSTALAALTSVAARASPNWAWPLAVGAMWSVALGAALTLHDPAVIAGVLIGSAAGALAARPLLVMPLIIVALAAFPSALTRAGVPLSDVALSGVLLAVVACALGSWRSSSTLSRAVRVTGMTVIALSATASLLPLAAGWPTQEAADPSQAVRVFIAGSLLLGVVLGVEAWLRRSARLGDLGSALAIPGLLASADTLGRGETAVALWIFVVLWLQRYMRETVYRKMVLTGLCASLVTIVISAPLLERVEVWTGTPLEALITVAASLIGAPAAAHLVARSRWRSGQPVGAAVLALVVLTAARGAVPISIEAVPQRQSVVAGEQVRLEFRLTGAGGRSVLPRLMDPPPQWSVPSAGRSGDRTMAVRRSGDHEVVVRAGPIEGRAQLTVTPSDPVRVVLEPSAVTGQPGETYRFSAFVEDRFGNEAVYPGRSVSADIHWSATGGSIDDGVYVSPGAAGSYEVGVRLGDLTASATVSVTPGVAYAISVEPESVTVAPGRSAYLRVWVRDRWGNALDDSRVEWSVEPPTVGTMFGALFTAGASAATGRLVARTAGLTQTVPVAVRCPAPETISGLTFLVGCARRADVYAGSALTPGALAEAQRQVDRDIDFIERDFGMRILLRPGVYLYADTDSYREGLVRIHRVAEARAAELARTSAGVALEQTVAVKWSAGSNSVIRHELVHVVIGSIARSARVPAWFNEGSARLAQYAVPGHEWVGAFERSQVASLAATGRLPALSELPNDESWGDGDFDYAIGATAVALLREDLRGQIAAFMGLLGAGRSIQEAYSVVAGRPFELFESEFRWRAQLGASRSDGLP